MEKRTKILNICGSRIGILSGVLFLIFLTSALLSETSWAELSEHKVTESGALIEHEGARKTPYFVNDIEKLDFPYNYTIGDSPYPWVSEIGTLLIILTLAGILIHGMFLVFSRVKRQREEPYVLKEVGRHKIYSIVIRLGHWLNAVCVITLIVSGFLMHYKGPSFALGHLHNVVGYLLLSLYLLFFIHELVFLDIRQFIPTKADLLPGLLKHAWFYMRGIFCGAEHPFHQTKEARLLPMQKMAYFGVMFSIMPVLALTGLILVNPEQMFFIVSAIGMENMKYVFVVHLIAAFGILSFLTVHLYMILIGDTVTQHITTMITGLHKSFKREKRSGQGS